jgi:hypothetical protein
VGGGDVRDSGGRMGGGIGSLMVSGLEQVHPRSVMDQLRGVWRSQDWRPKEHAKASKSGMVLMD